MADTDWKEETLPARSPTPDEQRRHRKHTLYQQLKARKVAERKEEPLEQSAAPERVSADSPTPPFSSISKRSISSRRKEIIQKHTRRKEEEGRTQEQIDAGKEESTSNKQDLNWLHTTFEESIDHSDEDVAVSKEELREREELMSEDVSVMDERPPLSEKSWDTRSILEHPPEPLVDPSWDTSKVHFDSKTEEPSTFKDSKTEIEDIFDFDTNLNDTGIGIFDTDSWAKTDMASSTDVDIEQEDARMIKRVENDVTSTDMNVKDEDKETTLGEVSIAEDSFETCESTLLEAALLMNGADVKHVNTSMDVNVGCFSSNTVFPALKDDEALLTFDQVRSDVDGLDVSEANKLTNQVAKKTRIDQYKERDDDPTSDNEEGDADSDDEEFANEEEIHYVSADSSEEEELVALVNAKSITVPETVGVSVQAEEFASFNAAASTSFGVNRKSIQAGSATTRDRSRVELENLELINTNSSTSSGKANSSILDSSVASSALFGESVLSLVGMSVNTEVTGTPATLRGIAMPPPPPPGSPTPKSSKNRTVTQKPLLKIPPPPPEKLRKWQAEKMRPMKHLEAKAKGRAASAERNSGLPQIAESDGSIPFITSFSTSHDEIEATLSEGLVNEYSTAGHHVDKEEAMSDTLTDMDEAAQIQMLNATSPKANSGTDSLIESPPHVSRMALEDTSLVASSADGVWKDADISKDAGSSSIEKVVTTGSIKTPYDKSSPPSTLKVSPVSDSKMAERLALASYTAARRFEENYPDVDEVDSLETIPVDSEKPSYDKVVPPEKPATSYFCAPDILAASICEPDEAEINGDNDTLLNHVPSQVKGWASMENAADDQIRPLSIYGSSFDDTHHAGLELVGGAFSTWRNSVYAYGPEPETTVSGSLDRVVDAAVVAVISKPKEAAVQAPIDDAGPSEEVQSVSWLEREVLPLSSRTRSEEVISESDQKVDANAHAALARSKLKALLEVDANLNSLCKYTSENIVMVKSLDDSSDSGDNVLNGQTPRLHPFSIPADVSKRPRCSVLAANFVSFLNRTSLLSGIESPFKDENPFIFDIVTASMSGMDVGQTESVREASTMQELVFQHELGDVFGIVRFFFKACGAQVDGAKEIVQLERETDLEVDTETRKTPPAEPPSLLYKIPTESPCPFEIAVWNMPSIVAIVLEFLGDPVVVCRMKLVNRFCNRLIHENEHVIMRDAVRLGGISMHIRPAFWMWITLEKCGRYTLREDQRDNATTYEKRDEANTPEESFQEANKASGDYGVNSPLEYQSKCITVMLPVLEKRGREGKWHHVIQRDVSRAFGNMPPHKTGARLRTDSIVRALVTWGRGRLLMRGVKGGGVAPPTPTIGGLQKQKSKLRPATGPPPWERGDGDADDNSSYKGPTETVTQWSGISPVPSFSSSPDGQSGPGESGSWAQKAALASSFATALEREPRPLLVKNSRAIEELALSGNTLTNEMKAGLQNQLGYILHALAAAHEDVGYCQGMDYIVAHLLRVLQDTVRYHSVRGTLCPVIGAQLEIPSADSDELSLSTQIDQAIDSSLVVEETVFRVMDTFFTTYNLRHMYWPELRCLKTCCRVFERLIQIKLPVLADHFAYHELNVGLFALGWFQTLFLYLPSMPSATVCHMWDIWLVERSFKIFFRVGTAILFLSQPILLNHELEGMMTYLNTFPDATLLNPDILIACALQIKVTNRMLTEIEREVTGGI